MANEQDEALGDMMEYEGVDDDVRDTDDGGAIVKIDDSPTLGESEFYANLAETMSEAELGEIGSTLCDLIEKDKESRKRRDEQYEEGLRRTGLGDDAPGGASFQGASKVVHPMLTQACIDFSSRVMKEIFPTAGPAKERIIGKPTKEKYEKSQRITKFMNWQMTRQMKDFRAELEQLSTQVPLAGAQYLKLTWDSKRKKPVPLFVSMDDVLLPYAATNFYTAERKTHVQYITRLEYQRRVQSGMYRDVDLPPAPITPETTKSERANDKIEGRSADTYNADGLRTIYESYVFDDIEGDTAPYIISVDKSTQKVLAIYRNWEEEDELQEEMNWIVEFPMIPWRGAYPIGFVHMIGGLSAAATGSLRALLDAAHISNFPGLIKMKGGAGGQTERIDPTEVHEIEGSFGQDDIRKVLMALPFNPPSAVLFQLLGFLIESSNSVVRTTFEDLADSNANVPVGTTLARIEQGMVVFNAIHGRIHDAMGRVLEVLYRINKMYLDEEEIFDETGELLAYRTDFDGPVNVMPVSDPNISTDTQRFAQTMAIVQRADAKPGLYDPHKVEEMFLRQLKVPDYEDLLVPKPEVQEMNAVNENLAATIRRPIAAFPNQEHLAHLQVHLDYMLNPIFGGSRLIGSEALPILLDHIKEHVALWYVTQVISVTSEATGDDIGLLQKDTSPEEKQELDKLLAAASQSVNQQAEKTLGAIPQIVEQAIQLLQSFRPPMPQDPSSGLMQAEIERKSAADQARMQIETQKLQMQQQTATQRIQSEIQRLQAELEREKMREQAELTRSQMEIEARLRMNAEDNQTAKQLAALEVQSGEKIAHSTGHGINPNPNV